MNLISERLATVQPPREVIEMQHEIILARLDEFSHKVHARAPRTELAESMLDLLSDLSMHFGYEESLMEVSDYPDFDHHRRQHIALVTELGLLLDRINTANDIQRELLRDLDFLGLWYRRHLDASDSGLDVWLAENFAV
jgi:hemerythrin-like metal-binding protein